MNIYQLLTKDNNLQTLIKLIRNDIQVDVTLIQHLSIYDKFNQLTGSKNRRYKLLAEEFRLHPKTIQRIILKLNKKTK